MRATQRLSFNQLLHQSVREGAASFPELLFFIFDPYLIMLSVNQGDIKYHFWVFGVIQPGIEPHFTHLVGKAYLIIYEGQLKSSLADQDTLMGCDPMRFIFQHSPPCGPYISFIRVVVFRSHCSKKSSTTAHPHIIMI